MPLTYRDRIEQLMDDAFAEADLPGENTAMLQERESTSPEPIPASAPEVSDVAPVELPEMAGMETPEPVEPIQVASEAPSPEPVELPPTPGNLASSQERQGVPEAPVVEVPEVELPPAPMEMSPSEVEIPQVQTVELPPVGPGETFGDEGWTPERDFGELLEGFGRRMAEDTGAQFAEWSSRMKSAWRDEMNEAISTLDQDGGL